MDVIHSIVEKLKTRMTPAQKEDWQYLLTRHLARLDAAAEEPVDKWGRTAAQQKEDDENPCRCESPTKSDNLKGCCGTCGFWRLPRCRVVNSEVGPCGGCGNFGRCSAWCEDNEEYWEPRTWQTCCDCDLYVLGLSNHQKTCDDYIRRTYRCDECDLLLMNAPIWGVPSKRCTCMYDQDDLNKMDLVNRRGF
jgi:hypothetical protein